MLRLPIRSQLSAGRVEILVLQVKEDMKGHLKPTYPGSDAPAIWLSYSM
jgi:hypothetical protein